MNTPKRSNQRLATKLNCFLKGAGTLLASIFMLQSAVADVVIYKITLPAHQVGGGVDRRINMTGYCIIDPNTLDVQLFGIYRLNGTKYFETDAVPMQDSSTAYGLNGGIYTVLRVSNSSTNGDHFTLVYGLNVNLPISPAKGLNYPRTMTGKSEAIDWDNTGAATIWDSVWTLSFSQKDTQNANIAGQTPEVVIANLRTKYLSLGYTDATNLNL